jgi:hypothetical protein
MTWEKNHQNQSTTTLVISYGMTKYYISTFNLLFPLDFSVYEYSLIISSMSRNGRQSGPLKHNFRPLQMVPVPSESSGDNELHTGRVSG